MVGPTEPQIEAGVETVEEVVEEAEEVHNNRTRDQTPLDNHLLTPYLQDVLNSGQQSPQSWKPAAFILTLQADNDAVTAGLWVMDIANVVTKGKTLKMSSTSTSIHNEGGYLPKRHPIQSI